MLKQLIIKEKNISFAWLEALNFICENRGKELSPLVINICDFKESTQIHDIINQHLKKHGFAEISTVAETIFPNSLYLYCKKNRNDLFREYLDNLVRIKAIDKANRQGTYFERLIAFGGSTQKINQLEIIISSLLDQNNNRRSKLQASIFNPQFDHKPGPYQNFPCLQHITCYKTKDDGLILNSFYALQYLFRRGYGNWLGLINLGKFIAEQSGLKFMQLNCFVGIEKLDKLNKIEAKSLLAECNKLIKK